MSGIYGVVRLARACEGDGGEGLAATLTAMRRVLRREGDGPGDATVDAQAGFAVGRIGRPTNHVADWPMASRAGSVYAAGHPEDAGGPEGLRGFYAALVLDRDGGIVLQADRTGMHPVFYGTWNGSLHFAPEAAALLEIPGAPRGADLAALGVFLASGTFYVGQTLFEGVRRLPGGMRLRMENGAARLEEYWRYAPGARGVRRESHADLVAEYAERIRAATARHLRDPGRATLFLSGGGDSRALLAAVLDAHGVGAGGLATVTWADYVGSAVGDAAVARRLAAAAGVAHRMIMRPTTDFGARFERANALLGGAQMAVDHPAEMDAMAEIAADGRTLVLRGDNPAGDRPAPANLEQAARFVNLAPLRQAPAVRALLRPEIREAALAGSEAVFADVARRYGALSPLSAKEALYLDVRLQSYLYRATYWRLRWFDERCPLLDDDVLDFLAETPDDFRAAKRGFKDTVAALWAGRESVPYAEHQELRGLADRLRVERETMDYVRGRFDADSGAWRILDRTAVRGLLDRVAAAPPRRGSLVRGLLRSGREALSSVAPWATNRLSHALKAGDPNPTAVLISALVFLDWHDRFVEGRTGRRAAADPTPGP